MDKVLIIEDDAELADIMKLYLQDAGLAVRIAGTGPDGIQTAAEWLPDIVLLDVMLPGLNGWEVLRRIRQTSRSPVIMVTALGTEEERVQGFETGADDYVVKPVLPRELVARVKAHLKRVSGIPHASKDAQLKFPGFQLSREQFTLHVDGRQVDLTPKEFELLWLLAGNPGRAFPRDLLLDRVWGLDGGDARTLEVHVSRLREKLGARKAWVKTIWGVGYKFEVAAS